MDKMSISFSVRALEISARRPFLLLEEGQIINKMLEVYEKNHKKEMTNEEVLAAVAGNDFAREPLNSFLNHWLILFLA